MKRKLSCSIVLTMALCLLSHTATFGTSQTPVGDPIVIIPTEQNDPNGPRGPVFNPFTAYLQNNQVVLASSDSCGLVEVEITSSTGFYYSTVFDTEEGVIVLPISGNVGAYTLRLTLVSGAVFVGSFVI
jgi:hypothetical protein